MSEKHVLVVRHPDRRHEFERCDFLGRWYPHGRGIPLSALLPPLIREIREAGGALSVTISSWRSGTAFHDPAAMSIPADGVVITVCPAEQAPIDRTLARLRLWQTITWHSPDQPPVLGAKLRQAGVADWLSDAFHRSEDVLHQWQTGAAGNMELWIRPQWLAPEMFPELFPSPKPAEQKQPDETPAGVLTTLEALKAHSAEHVKMRQRKLGARRNARHAADMMADKEKAAAAIKRAGLAADKKGRK